MLSLPYPISAGCLPPAPPVNPIHGLKFLEDETDFAYRKDGRLE
ncbi:hypothetical protein SK141_0719 [Streptococcus oralis]|nr:hypothetical protein [Streptococcus oralis]KEQ46243.1 hypothetical protein SK141_0719 [Streptococcus oralis]